MRNKIEPNKIYWASFNRFELRMPGEAVIDCSHSGQCDDDVDYWMPQIKELSVADGFKLKPTKESIRAELKEYGAWDDEELDDAEQNWKRLVWIAANNINEEIYPDCSMPLARL